MEYDFLERVPPVRTIEQALEDLVHTLDRLPGNHPKVAPTKARIADLEFFILAAE